jgi:hypothetical protein
MLRPWTSLMMRTRSADTASLRTNPLRPRIQCQVDGFVFVLAYPRSVRGSTRRIA